MFVVTTKQLCLKYVLVNVITKIIFIQTNNHAQKNDVGFVLI